MFEKASRTRLRFNSSIGVLAVEDLWGLSLKSLDEIAKRLNKQIQDKEISFIEAESKEDSELTLAFDIVKHVIAVRLEESKQAKEAAELRERRKRLEGILADKQDEALKAMSAEEIQKELDALS